MFPEQQGLSFDWLTIEVRHIANQVLFCKLKKLTLNEKSLLKMYNSVIECVKVSNIFIGLKKRLVWACLKGVTL